MDCVPILSRLTAPLGKFAVLGNHDLDQERVAEALEKSGFVVLRNANQWIRKGDEQVAIAGVEDWLTGEPDIHLALEGIPEDTCTILLSHCPDYAEEVPEGRVDLQLSGHSHGGQICIPLIGPLVTPPRARKYVDGLYRLPSGIRMFVNRGIGTTFSLFASFAAPNSVSWN